MEGSSRNSDRSAQSGAGATPTATASTSSSPAQPPPRRHLALPVEQRANLRRLMDTLQRRASKTKIDLEVGAAFALVFALVRSVASVGCLFALGDCFKSSRVAGALPS